MCTHTSDGASPKSGSKRGRSDDSVADVHEQQTAKAQKLYESQGRPKAKDYDNVTQEILGVAIPIYRCLVCTRAPFPDHTKELEFVKIAWRKACEQVEVRLEMTPELIRMVYLCIIWLSRQLLMYLTDNLPWISCPRRTQIQVSSFH